jgi:hypothetical protein
MLFGGENPPGKRPCRFPVTSPNQAVWHTIVGIASDVRNGGLSDHNDPEWYLARRRGSTEYADIPMAPSTLVHGAPGFEAALRREIAAADPALPGHRPSLRRAYRRACGLRAPASLHAVRFHRSAARGLWTVRPGLVPGRSAQAVQEVVQQVLEAEMEEAAGAAKRTESRIGYRSG